MNLMWRDKGTELYVRSFENGRSVIGIYTVKPEVLDQFTDWCGRNGL